MMARLAKFNNKCTGDRCCGASMKKTTVGSSTDAGGGEKKVRQIGCLKGEEHTCNLQMPRLKSEQNSLTLPAGAR